MPTPDTHHGNDRKVAGAALMIAGMFVFPIGDAAAKFLSDAYSTVLLSWVRFAVGALALLPIALLMRTPPITLGRRIVFEQVLRAVLIVAATVLFIAAISRIPLADTVGAYFTAPIIAAVLSVVVLKEPLRRSTVIATALGFVGMLLIVRPGASMEIGFLYALAAGVCFGAFLVATRWAIHDVPTIKVVAFQTAFGAVLLLPFVLGEIASIATADLWLFLAVGLASALANVLTISALRLAPASLLAPLVYFEIIGATILGFVVFGDLPSAMTLAGIGAVILGGLVLIERRPKA